VRQPVRRHEMGRVIPIGDSHALAQAVKEIMAEKKTYGDRKVGIRETYAPDTIAQKYEDLFARIQTEIQ
jgi:hypothetical protein